MKTINGIDDKLAHFEGQVNPDLLPSYRSMLVRGLASAKAKNGEESLNLFDIALRFKHAEGTSVELSDEEYALLKEKCEANELQWLAFYHAQILRKIKGAA